MRRAQGHALIVSPQRPRDSYVLWLIHNAHKPRNANIMTPEQQTEETEITNTEPQRDQHDLVWAATQLLENSTRVKRAGWHPVVFLHHAEGSPFITLTTDHGDVA